MSIQTLVVTNPPNPSILVLCPTDDYEKHRNCRIVPIWLGTFEATAIGMALEQTKPARPMTHDLLLDAITNLDATVESASITDQTGQTFFAKLTLSHAGREIELDARPSDAVALAVRQGSPIYMEEEVLKRASFPYIFKEDKMNEEELSEFHTFVQNLDPDDFLQ